MMSSLSNLCISSLINIWSSLLYVRLRDAIGLHPGCRCSNKRGGLNVVDTKEVWLFVVTLLMVRVSSFPSKVKVNRIEIF